MSEKNIRNDYEYSRDTYYELLEKGKQSLELMIEVARESEHPRAFEVLSGMMKNMADINDLIESNPESEVILIESGGDNLSATFSPELVDAFIYVIVIAEGDKTPRKGTPAMQDSDLMIINKTELAPYVGLDLDVMDRESKIMQGSPVSLLLP